MTRPLSPIVSGFDTQEQADSHEHWFRAQVEASLADDRPTKPHDEVMAEIDNIIAQQEARGRKQA